jgi:hypothetical protein
MAVAIRDLKLSLKYYKSYYKQINKLNNKSNLIIYNSLSLKERNIILISFKVIRILKSYKRKI